MLKVSLVGAGSSVFARQIITDILAVEGLDEGEFALIDIDAQRLAPIVDLARRMTEMSGKRWTVRASTERRDVLPGTHFLINTIETGGVANVAHDYDIPLKYGIDQCIGDTIGPGGIFKALRTGPAWLAILRDAEHLCPDAWVLNYTNPMSILTQAALEGTSMRTVGLCHSVQGTSEKLARWLGVPYEDLRWTCAGINHNAWFTELSWLGEDLYPRLRELAQVPEIYEQDPVRFDMMMHFGAFVTESSGHFSEYVPYYRKRPDLLQQYVRSGYRGASGFYARNWVQWREDGRRAVERMVRGEDPIPTERSHEYGADIVEAIALNRPTVIHGNVRNTHLIENLPDGCVEVACLVDVNGVQPIHVGVLPEQLAALNRAHMGVHRLMVDALLHGRVEAARYALYLDPLSAAVCSPAELSALFDEMWAAEAQYLTPFQR